MRRRMSIWEISSSPCGKARSPKSRRPGRASPVNRFLVTELPGVAPRLMILALIPSRVKFSSFPVAAMVHPANVLFYSMGVFTLAETVFCRENKGVIRKL